MYETQLKDKDKDVSISSKLYLTQLEAEFDCDAFYPVKYLGSLECLEKSESKLENDITYTFSTWNLSWNSRFTQTYLITYNYWYTGMSEGLKILSVSEIETNCTMSSTLRSLLNELACLLQ